MRTGSPPINVVLLAAGYATRLGGRGTDAPKGLLDLGGRPLLDRLLEGLVDYPGRYLLTLVTNTASSPST